MQVVNRKPDGGRENGWLRAVGLVIAWLIIFSLARDVWQIRVGFNRITESENRLIAEEAKNLNLKQKLELAATGEYRERLIREKLNMQKEGEVLVVLPKKTDLGTEDEVVAKTMELNWEKWWKLIR